MDRVSIKTRAKDLVAKYFGAFWKAYIIIFVIQLLTSLIVGGGDVNEISPTRSIATIIIGILELPLSFGLSFYLLNIVRNKKFEMKDLFKYYKYILPLIVIQILITMFTLLWSILFIIPGIIAALSYSMAVFIFVDGEVEPLECIRKSKELMKGYKGDYFVFIFSFIGWILLGILTFGLLYIWLIPYIQFATAIYYDDLVKVRKKDKNELTKY